MKESRKILIKKSVLYAFFVILLFCLLILIAGLGMEKFADSRVFSLEEFISEETDMKFDCILVLGAGLKKDGSLSNMLEDRVSTSVELYSHGVSERILMSGDHSGDYNEVGAMKNAAVESGVESSHVFLDHEGYSTYESLWRVKEVFGAERVLIVSQEYHLYRAIYIADQLGIEAYGVSADTREYSKRIYRELREMLARFKDLYLAASRSPINEDYTPISLKENGDVYDTNIP